MRKCLRCGADIPDAGSALCPACGAEILSSRRRKIWPIALVQIVLAAAFMFIFKFPKMMIAVFVGFILIATLLSAWMKSKPLAARPAPQVSSSHPIAFRVLSVLIALGALTVFATLLFGSVISLNNWELWQKYDGQPHHRADFVVDQTYFQKLRKGGIDVYARGTVEGSKEWMNLQPYLGSARPHNWGELDDLVPEGTSIPIDLFPEMKGRMRVRVHGAIPAADGYRAAAASALKNSLIILIATAGMLFLLVRIRRSICDENAPASAAQAVSNFQ